MQGARAEWPQKALRPGDPGPEPHREYVEQGLVLVALGAPVLLAAALRFHLHVFGSSASVLGLIDDLRHDLLLAETFSVDQVSGLTAENRQREVADRGVRHHRNGGTEQTGSGLVRHRFRFRA